MAKPPPIPFFDYENARKAFEQDPGKTLASPIEWHVPCKDGAGFPQRYATRRVAIVTGVVGAKFFFQGSASIVREEARFGEINFTIFGGPINKKELRILGLDVAPPEDPLRHPIRLKGQKTPVRYIVGNHMHRIDRIMGTNPAEEFLFDRSRLRDPVQGWLDALNMALLDWGIMPVSPNNWNVGVVRTFWSRQLPLIAREEGL